MFRDFSSFVAALWREWKVLLTGGSIVAILALLHFFGVKSLPQNVEQSVSWLIVGLTLILAAFFAWRRQWIDADRNFLTLPLEELTRLTEDCTKVHANTLIRPYLGKKIRCPATIDNVYPDKHLAFVTMKHGALQITLRLPRWKIRPFVPLPKGTIVTVVGRIYAISKDAITLTNCHIVPALPEVPPGGHNPLTTKQ
jgi:hypothetical protein